VSVYERNGRWYVNIPAKRSGLGRRVREVIPNARNKEQALKAELKILADIFNGQYDRARSRPVLFEKFVEEVYLPWSRQNKKSARCDVYRARTLTDFFRGKTLTEISPLLVEKYKRWRADCTTPRGTHPEAATINVELAQLARIFSMALDNRLVDSNPCSRVRPLRAPKGRERCMTRDEEQRLMPELYGHIAPLVRLAIGTGMREGELCRLEWARVDFASNLILVTETKSGRDRHVPMSAAVRALLLGLNGQRRGPFVFPGRGDSSRHVSDSYVRENFHAATLRARIEDLCFHDLRHTAATRMAEAGAHIVDIKAVLGHADIKMTARYAHSTTDGARRAVELIQTGPGEVVRLEKKG
jgi:integrase